MEKWLFGGVLALVLGSWAVLGKTTPVPVPQTLSKVGSDPGGVKSNPDRLLETAKARGREVAILGGGCFWCVEGDFRLTKGVTATAVGYSQGSKPNPTYKEVCTGTTGHAEVTLIEFDPKVLSYRQVIERFFVVHDPTTLNRQGPDVGTQYRSGIYYLNDAQAKIARQVVAELTKAKKFRDPIVTEIQKAQRFWMAEDYHQQYYEKRGIVH